MSDNQNYHNLQGVDMYESLVSADLDKELRKIACSEKVNYNTHQGTVALGMAMFFSDPKIAKFLIEAGVQIDKDKDFLLYAAIAGSSLENIKLLVKEGADPHKFDEDGITTLMSASQSSDDEIFDYFLNIGVDPLLVSKSNKTALHFVSSLVTFGKPNNSFKRFKLLIEKGCDPLLIDNKGESILHLSAEAGNSEIFFAAIDMGLDIFAVTKSGDTLLHSAAYGGNEKIFNFLLDKKLDVFAKNNDDFTVLHKATYTYLKSDNIISKLLDMGLDPLLKTKNGQHSLHFACRKLNKENITRMIKMGCNMHDKDSNGSDCFDYALDETIEEFLKKQNNKKRFNDMLFKFFNMFALFEKK